tara:strand:+ start:2355 stop:2471 length:117 start_codon:yes stop_codon:yes gene_type:complete
MTEEIKSYYFTFGIAPRVEQVLGEWANQEVQIMAGAKR